MDLSEYRCGYQGTIPYRVSSPPHRLGEEKGAPAETGRRQRRDFFPPTGGPWRTSSPRLPQAAAAASPPPHPPSSSAPSPRPCRRPGDSWRTISTSGAMAEASYTRILEVHRGGGGAAAWWLGWSWGWARSRGSGERAGTSEEDHLLGRGRRRRGGCCSRGSCGDGFQSETVITIGQHHIMKRSSRSTSAPVWHYLSFSRTTSV